MKLGFAVKVLGPPALPSHDTRRWASKPHLGVSIGFLHRIFDYLREQDITMYRMATGIAPYASHPELRGFRDQPARFHEELAELGERAKGQDLRLSTHPGQYTVLNSRNEPTVLAAIEELEVQAELLDGMGLGDEAVVVLHVGGVAGDKDEALERFERGFERLSENAQKRLVVENDDRSFGLGDVLGLSERIGCRIVWDVLHHHCYDPDGISDRDAIRLAAATWKGHGATPKIHYSTPRTTMEVRKKKIGRKTVSIPGAAPLRAHAELIDPLGFEWFLETVVRDLDVDVMLEAKGKDVALLALRTYLRARNIV